MSDLGQTELEKRKSEWDAKNQEKAPVQRITITAIDIPFGQLVGFMVKAGIAAIPAGIIVAVFWGFVASLLPRWL